MEFERLTAARGEKFEAAEALIAISFPIHEQRERASQGAIMSEPEYNFDLIRDGGEWAGLMLFWETARFIYVEHFCIRPELRSSGIGRRALGLIAGRGKTVILEIDPPVDDISIRRRGFYERAGFCENPFRHVHPPYHAGARGHELVIMTSPEKISRGLYDEFDEYLKTVVMGR